MSKNKKRKSKKRSRILASFVKTDPRRFRERVVKAEKGKNRKDRPRQKNWSDPNGNTDEEDELVSGFLKWDGCMNWKTGDIMYHFCDPEDADRLATFFKKLYELGSEHISHWSY